MFRTQVDQYLRAALHKGVPPLFIRLKELYKSPEKVSKLSFTLMFDHYDF